MYNMFMIDTNEIEKYVQFLLNEGSETPNHEKRLMYIRTAKLLLELHVKIKQTNSISNNSDMWKWPPVQKYVEPVEIKPVITCTNDKSMQYTTKETT